MWDPSRAAGLERCRDAQRLVLRAPRGAVLAGTSVGVAHPHPRAQVSEVPWAEAETPGVDATLIAFQVFGHPRLRLDRG